MPPRNRAIWYIYTRNLLQKGGHFTQFARKDYPLFASILDNKPHNIGHWIFQELTKFKFQSRKTSQIPFPNLISVILFDHKVWYLSEEANITPSRFGLYHLNYMQIYLTEGSGQSKAPSQSKIPKSKGKAKATTSKAQEAQSEQTPLPTNMESFMERITQNIEEEVSRLVKEVCDGHTFQMESQEEIKIAQLRLEEKVDKAIKDQEEMKRSMDLMRTQQEEQAVSISTLLVTVMSLSDKLDQVLKKESNNEAGPSSEGHFAASPIPSPRAERTPPSSPLPISSIPAEEYPINPPSPETELPVTTPSLPIILLPPP